MPTVSRRYPVAPPVESLRYRVPVQSAAVGTLIDNLVHQAGWRALRSVTKVWDYDAPTSGTLEGETPNGTGYTVRATMELTGLEADARAVFLLVVYQAYELPSGTAAAIVAHLDNLTDGDTSKDSIKWAVGEGSLPEGRSGAAGSRLFPPQVVTSTMAIDPSPAATPSGPRCLNLDDDDDAGDIVQIRLACTDARPLALYAVEAYQAVLT